ncbi:MAG: helix-turn-helix domain-containing protein [Candidatus Woesearchaeota archaeon]
MIDYNTIKKIRTERGLTQAELGEKMKPPVSGAYIQQIETGKKNPSIKTINRIAKALEINSSELFGVQDDINNTYKINSNYAIVNTLHKSKIWDLVYDLFKEVYDYSKLKQINKVTAKEFMKKDKYFIASLAESIVKTILAQTEVNNYRTKNKDNSPIEKPIYITYAPNNKEKDDNDMVVDSVNSFELGNKLNDKKYLKYMINKYQEYLDNIEKGKDNYKLIEEELEEARKKYNKNQNNKEDNNIREANQEDIDNFFGR